MNNIIERYKWFIEEYPNKSKNLQHLSRYSYEYYIKKVAEYENTRRTKNQTTTSEDN